MKQLLLLLSLAAGAFFVYDHVKTEEKQLRNLNEDNFWSFHGDNSFAFLMAYVPIALHTDRILEAMSRLAKDVSFEGGLAKINCYYFDEVCKSELDMIHGYPTVLYWTRPHEAMSGKTEVFVYNGAHHYYAMKEFYVKNHRPASLEPEELSEFLEYHREEFVVVTKNLPLFEIHSLTWERQVPVKHCYQMEVRAQQTKREMIVYFDGLEVAGLREGSLDKEFDWSRNSLVDWLRAEAVIPRVQEVQLADYVKHRYSGIATLWMFRDVNQNEANAAATDAVEQVLERRHAGGERPKIKAVWIDGDRTRFHMWSHLNILHPLPKIILLHDHRKFCFHETHGDEITVENLHRFLDAYASEELQHGVFWETPEEIEKRYNTDHFDKTRDDLSKVLSSRVYEDETLRKSTHHVVTWIYSRGCEKSRHFSPIWRMISRHYHMHSGLQVTKINLIRNDVPFKVHTLPMIVFYFRDSEGSVIYDGVFHKKPIVKWIDGLIV